MEDEYSIVRRYFQAIDGPVNKFALKAKMINLLQKASILPRFWTSLTEDQKLAAGNKRLLRISPDLTLDVTFTLSVISRIRIATFVSCHEVAYAAATSARFNCMPSNGGEFVKSH